MKLLLLKASFLMAVILLLLVSCKKASDKSDKVILLTHKWVEKTERADTITFDSELLIVGRKKEINSSGSLIPKMGSGPYMYKLENDNISLMWALSSQYAFKEYKYSIVGNTLYIDDFYKKTAKTLMFERLK